MRIFMLGWEFPPFISGGLGTACYGLTRALSDLGHQVLFVLPRAVPGEFATHVELKTPSNLIAGLKAAAAVSSTRPGEVRTGTREETETSYTMHGLDHVEFRAIAARLSPYGPMGPSGMERIDWHGETIESQVLSKLIDWQHLTGQQAQDILAGTSGGGIGEHYSGDMFAEVHRYALLAMRLAMQEHFDVIHAHDWMTYPAGMGVAALTGKPLVVHIHSTEFDRSGEHVNQRIYDIEREGMHRADVIIAVSHLTKSIVAERYGISPDKIRVVYNAIDSTKQELPPPPPIRRDEKIVLFLGRITMQKGPEYFLQAAREVLRFVPNVRFVMAGSGDMIRRSIELAAELGIGHKVVFTGFLRGADVARVYKMADLYVMPSVSEPFGIAPLEALSHDVPVLISKQSGVSEVLTHVLKVDFWDIHEMANKIVAVLRHPPLQTVLRQHGNFEIRKLTWRDSARGNIRAYGAALAKH